MKVLVIDNTLYQADRGAKDFRKFAKLAPEAAFFVRRAPEEDLPESLLAYDKIILTGSATPAADEKPWIKNLENLLREALDAGKPILGICYGHQVLARILGDKSAVGRGRALELGWTEVRLTGKSRIVDGLPAKFFTFSAHYDEIKKLPPQCEPIAASEICAIQGFVLKGKPVFGLQFHPERDLAGADESYREAVKDGEKDLFQNYERGKYLYNPKIGETIFKNFLRLQ